VTARRINYRALTPLARGTIDEFPGVTIAGYVRHWWTDGQWHGDRCGCTDDRCIGFHHEDATDCRCLPVLLEEYRREVSA
jgi:hypothetical protein